MRFGTTNNTLRDSLLTEDPFAYAHLVKFERPLKTDSGKSARRAKDYSYITDGSVDIIFNDGSSDITDSVSFSISNILATSSTGIGFGSLIGRNDSTSKSWYKIGALRYVNNETLVTLGNVNNLVESTPGGISYYGTSDRSQIPDTNDVANISSDTVFIDKVKFGSFTNKTLEFDFVVSITFPTNPLSFIADIFFSILSS